MILIVGLGNPGEKYQKTRHNIGFDLVDQISKNFGFPVFKKKFEGLLTKKKIFKEEVLLFKPITYMNSSGKPIKKVFDYFKVKYPENVIVFQDDLDMNLCKIRIKNSSGDGGHNGIKDIIKNLGNNFFRIKIGIGNNEVDDGKKSAEVFVLEKFKKSEILLINFLKKKINTNFKLIIKKEFKLFLNDINKE